MPARSYLSQSELPVTIGVGAAREADTVEITWPGGVTQKVTEWKVDGITTVEQARAGP